MGCNGRVVDGRVRRLGGSGPHVGTSAERSTAPTCLSITPKIQVRAMQSPMKTRIKRITLPIRPSPVAAPPQLPAPRKPMSVKKRGMPQPRELTRNPISEPTPVIREPVSM